MQAFTPWVEEALRAFNLTHELRIVGLGGVSYERVGWPDPAGLARQEAKFVEGLRALRAVHNELLQEAMAQKAMTGRRRKQAGPRASTRRR